MILLYSKIFLVALLGTVGEASDEHQIIRPAGASTVTGETTLEGNGDIDPNHTAQEYLHPEKENDSQCDLFMAPSTIPGAGLGIFTRSAKERGEMIGYALKDASIEIDMESVVASSASSAAKDQAVHLLRNYTWSRDEYSEVLVLGIDSLMNSHLAAANVKHYDSGTVAITDIPAGGEAWSYYGDHWFRARFRGTEEEMPGIEDYEQAESFIKEFYAKVTAEETDDHIARQQWDEARASKKTDRSLRLWNALPAFYDDAKEVALKGMSIFHQKPQDGLQHNSQARCVDGIEIVNGKAYAARDFPAESLITGSPMLHFVEGARYLPHSFLERCFGSSESSLILCPYGPGISAMAHLYAKDENNSKEPNVKAQWTPEGQLHQKAGILEGSVSNFLNFMEPVTSMDFYAVSDIKRGDPLRLPTTRLSSVDHAATWNESLSSLILKTESEQLANPYPANLEVQCHRNIQHSSTEELVWNESTIVPCQIKERIMGSMGASISYTVRAFIDGSWTRVAGVHRRYIRFVDIQFDTMDMSSIMPKSWKNIDLPLQEREEL